MGLNVTSCLCGASPSTCNGGGSILSKAGPSILFWIPFTFIVARAPGHGAPSTSHPLFPLSSPTWLAITCQHLKCLTPPVLTKPSLIPIPLLPFAAKCVTKLLKYTAPSPTPFPLVRCSVYSTLASVLAADPPYRSHLRLSCCTIQWILSGFSLLTSVQLLTHHSQFPEICF